MSADYDKELAAKVLNLRRGGIAFDRIADQLNITARAAKVLFDQALGANDPEFARDLETDRLDQLHRAVWPNALQGDLEAVDRVLRISERREKVTARPAPNTHSYRDAYDKSVLSANVTAIDGALIESGRQIADRIDEAIASGVGTDVTKAMYLVPHMMNVLRELLATPATRLAAGLVVNDHKDGKLAQLKAVHGKKSAG